MKKKSFGFTLIEVAFFIAITGLLFVGIIAGTQSSIWQQRYNDSVQNFADFLRNIYAEASSIQGVSDGRSDKAIYGKMISFGQKVGLDGKEISKDQQVVFVYDLIGDASGSSGNDIKAALASLGINVVKKADNSNKAEYAGIVESYSPIWGAVIEGVTPGSNYSGTILVVRNPNTGLVNTLVSGGSINVNSIMRDYSNDYENNNKVKELLTGPLRDWKDGNEFKVDVVDFCLNPYGLGQTGMLRRDIRLVKNARNASGVEIIDLVNDSRNACANK